MATLPPPPARATRSLIINSPYERPAHHWIEANGQMALAAGRRSAGYEIFDTRHNTRRVEPIELVNRIRERVEAWRAADYPGITTVTRGLLEHWHDKAARERPFYFCQLEAIETLIWWVEGAADHKQGLAVPGDGGAWERICSKMATGAGKTTVMAMIITWQALNALTYPKETKRFSKAILIIAPGLTVKGRLQILKPGHPQNYYDEFGLCPSEALRQRLNHAEVLIENWHALMPLKEPARSVVKKGAERDPAYVKRVLGRLAQHKDLVVINDEAHHAYRMPEGGAAGRRRRDEDGVDDEEATRWIEGLDRIHGQQRIARCFDLSATPFIPAGGTNTEHRLFGWIVSDFGLNDAIEAGLVKTPRVVVRDNVIPDSRTLKPKLYHLYRDPSVGDDLNRRGAAPHEALPQLVQQAYTLLGADWRAAWQRWQTAGHVVRPVMLTVCNRTETAARIEHYFNAGNAHWPELQAPARTLRVDSKVLSKAEQGEEGGSDKDYDARLREIIEAAALPDDTKARLLADKKEGLLRQLIDNVGKLGGAGQDLQNVISVAMLSEGWDAKNVTHILGLRAFASQLLCEQVIGRGLRRVGYDLEKVVGPDGVERELFAPEYVNVFGVPLSIFLDDSAEGEAPPPPRASHPVAYLPERAALDLRWPNVVRIETVLRPTLEVDWAQVPALRLDPTQIPTLAELAPALAGATDLSRAERIDLAAVPEAFRLQRLTFAAAKKAFEGAVGRFRGPKEMLMVQLVRLVERFLTSDLIEIPGEAFREPARRRLLLALAIDRVVQHLMIHVTEQNAAHIEPVFDEEFPIGATSQLRTWYTSREVLPTLKSPIGGLVVDSAWEQFASNLFERSPLVASYAKNDHLGFQVFYLWEGARRRYVPDYLVRLANGKTLVLEVKGQDSAQVRAKQAALNQWIEGVNAKGGFGVWCADLVLEMARLEDVLAKHGG